MIAVKDLYRAFNESRRAARERATLAVTGDSPRAAELAALLGAQRGVQGAEIILAVPEGDGPVTLSGKAVEDPGEVSVSSVTKEALAEELIPEVVRALDEGFLIALGRGYLSFRREVCEQITRNNARQNAVIGAFPVPGADMPVMTANQGRMVLSIAAAHGEDLTLERARELLGVLASGFGFRALGRQAAKLLPYGGWAAASAVGYAGTIAMGRAATLYFERGGQQLGAGEMAAIRQRARKEADSFASRLRRR